MNKSIASILLVACLCVSAFLIVDNRRALMIQFIVLSGGESPALLAASQELPSTRWHDDYFTIDEFINEFNFEGMEPFTIILYNKGDFKELKWDELELHVRSLSLQNIHLWSSATLYNQEWWLDRSVNFKEFVARKQPDQVGIMDYHKTVLLFEPEALQALLGSQSPLTNLPVKTTSVSSLEKTSLGFKFKFHRTDDKVKLSKSNH